jgi:O-antigen ligase
VYEGEWGPGMAWPPLLSVTVRAPARIAWPDVGVALAALALVVAVAFADGGYFADSWSWIVVALSSSAGIAVLTRPRVTLGLLELGTIGAVAAFVGWVALSATWSSAAGDSVDEVERSLIYVAAIVALPLAVDPERTKSLIAGLAGGITLVVGYGLADRLFLVDSLAPDAVGGTRLVEPIGYANAVGILAVIGIVLSLGFAAAGETRVERSLGAACPIVLLPALTLTESRGAWIALAVGLGAWSFVEVDRTRFLATAALLAPPAVLAVLLTERAAALTDAQSTPTELDDAGRGLAVAIVLLAVVAALLCLGARRLESRLPTRLAWISYVVLPALLVTMTLAAMLRPRRSLDARIDYWRVAWDQFETHPWLGSGAGTFVHFWERSGIPSGVRDAHSLYLETLAELGPFGLLLLVAALALPLVAAVRARRRPFVGVALGAYAAFVVHAGLDWDWEMPVVTLAGLICAVAILAAARLDDRVIELGPLARYGALVTACGLAALAFALRFPGNSGNSLDGGCVDVFSARGLVNGKLRKERNGKGKAPAHRGTRFSGRHAGLARDGRLGGRGQEQQAVSRPVPVQGDDLSSNESEEEAVQDHLGRRSRSSGAHEAR